MDRLHVSSRRRLATYAKSNRRAVVPDLFNVTAAPKELSPFSASTPPSDESADIDSSADPSHQLAHELNEAANASSTQLKPKQIQPAMMNAKHTISARARDTQAAKHTKQRPAKHTKYNHHNQVSQPGRPASPVHSCFPSVFDLDSSSDSSPRHAKKRSNRSAQTMTLKDNVPATRKPPPRLHSKLPTGIRKPVSSGRSRTTESEVADSGSLRPSLTLSSPEPWSSQERPAEPWSPKSDHSGMSMASSKSSTPKRKRQGDQYTASDPSSPSRLELSALLLSSEKHGCPGLRPSGTQAIDTATTRRPPSNPRQRLVDRLDSPPPSQLLPVPDASDDKPSDDKPRPKKSRKILASTEQRHGIGSDSQRPPLPPPRPGPTEARLTQGSAALTQPPARLRTYGRQRSHLKDMVASETSQNSSQGSLHDLVSQVEALTATKSGFELEDESDDDDDGEPAVLKPKSIHELRHGGLANRFNMELDTLFEDIDSANKSLRIQALMSLVRKLQEKTFKAHLLASGKFGRLSQVAAPQLDLSSAMLILLALWALCVDETATCQALVQIYSCLVHLPPSILIERRGLHQIAKDTRQNLSKALIRDLADFEQHVIDQSVQKGGSRRATCIVVSRVSVQCLNYTLRRIILLEGQPQDAAPPPAFLRSAMACIRQHLQDMSSTGQRQDHQVESIRLLLSWLERTAVTCAAANLSHAGADADADQVVEELGTLLADVMQWANKQQQAHPHKQPQLQQPDPLEQSCIRTVVELSNRDVVVCGALASTPLLSTLFAVVDQHFARLETSLTHHGGNDQRLDSAILALGCLLNFAECSAEVRLKMATEGQVDRLVKYFNFFADQVEEATTEELTQTLGVPFGYLCLLLCALCLDSSNQKHISSVIKGDNDGLNPLWLQAETCLHHMRIIDNDGFTDRFNTMLDKVKGLSS